MKTFIPIIFFLSTLSATIINIPDEFPTIQQGIDASANGDTVLVQPATYHEIITFNGHNITLGSLYIITGDTSYISQTVIDGDFTGTVVTFSNQENLTTLFEGFTVKEGNGTYAFPNYSYQHLGWWDITRFGGGIICKNQSSPKLKNLRIIHNFGILAGGGIYCHNSSPLIDRVEIVNNSAVYGAGIAMDENSSPIIKNTLIHGNDAGSNGIAIFCNDSSPSIINTTISNNYGTSEGVLYCYNGSYLSIVNTIIWGNTPMELFINPQPESSVLTISYSNIEGGEDSISPTGEPVNWLNGNIVGNPFFNSPESGGFTLLPESPCIDSGDPDSPFDPDCTIKDMGAYYYDQSDDICPIAGDVNSDCDLNIVDVVLIVDCILNASDACICGDMDGDGQANIFDVVWLVDVIVNY